jgi:hypothetical protein
MYSGRVNKTFIQNFMSLFNMNDICRIDEQFLFDFIPSIHQTSWKK